MSLFEIGMCIGGLGLVMVLVIANDHRKSRVMSKSTKFMYKAGGIMAIVGGILAIIGAIIEKL